MAHPVQHLVLFRLRGQPDPEMEEEMRRQISSWVGVVPGLRRLRFGADVGGRSDGYQFCLLTEFDDEESLAAYVPHPLHQAFLNWVLERPFDVLRFDHALNEKTSLWEGSAAL